MGWIASLGIALVTGLLGLFGAGTVASLVVEWYNVSSFEGGAGFFVVGMALFGGIGGAVIGLVVSRVVARRPRPTFIKALGSSCAVLAAILAVVTGASWMFADIPPTIDGEELFLLVEIRWPASGAAAPAAMTGVPYLRLGALRGSVARRVENGPLFVEDARLQEGRWIVPGAVPIFTSRGGRLLDFGAGGHSIAGFIVPLPRYPWQAQRQWSEWLPTGAAGEPPQPQGFTYRFKVVRHSESLRTEKIGPFEVDTIASHYYHVGEGSRLAASATFSVRHNGQPVPGIAAMQTVAVVGGAKPALFVTAAEPDDGTPCALLVDDGGTLRVQRVSGCATPVTERLLTSDPARFKAAKALERLPGWVDRVSFAQPGLFQIDTAILDTRDLTSTQFLFPADVRPDSGVPPLALSPDERSFVWLAQGSDEEPRLGVTDRVSGASYILPVDRGRMRYNTSASLDPAWIQHHFSWQRNGEGVDVLVERPAFVPLPYRGELTLGKPGDYQAYTLRPGAEPLRAAVVDLLVREFGGERLPDEAGGYLQRVRLDGNLFAVSVVDSPPYVSVSMDGASSDPRVMSAIGARLDAALASGRHDSLFVVPEAAK